MYINLDQKFIFLYNSLLRSKPRGLAASVTVLYIGGNHGLHRPRDRESSWIFVGYYHYTLSPWRIRGW